MSSRSLDSIAKGETITVDRILFETLRSHCARQGVEEGARLRLRGGDGERLELETPGGRAVPCERRYARFIEVRSAGPPAPRTTDEVGGEHGGD